MVTASHLRAIQTSSIRKNVREQTFSSINTTRGLPENTVYRDTGCDLAPSCLVCPLALCKYDDANGARHGRTVMRDQEIMRLRGQGLKVSQIAKIVKTSERTVYRVAQRDGAMSTMDSSSRPNPKHRSPIRPIRLLGGQRTVWRQYRIPAIANERLA